MLAVGDVAPPFDALAGDGSRFSLYERDAAYTVLYFFPRAFTPGCTRMTRRFGANLVELALAGADVAGVSTDDDATQCAFSRAVGASFPLIADPDRTICRAFRVLWPILGVARRVTYVVGPLGQAHGDGIPRRRIEAVFHHELDVGEHLAATLRHVDAGLRARRPECRRG